MILVVIITRKRIVIIGTILLLVGAMVIVCGIIGAGNVVEEKTYNSDPEEGYEWLSEAQESYEYLYRMANKDPTPPLIVIDPVIILGTIVAASGVVFLVKSKDENFLPGI